MAEIVTVPVALMVVPPCPDCKGHVVKTFNTYQCTSCRRVFSLVTDKFDDSGRNQSMPSKKRGTRVVGYKDESPKATQESYMDTQVEAETIETVSTLSTPVVTTSDPEDLADAGLDKPKATKERRTNGALESLVKAVTDAYVQGQIDTDGKPLTPYRIARLIDEKFPSTIKTSTGAVTECLKRWREYGFATFAEGDDTPMAFGAYTDEARAKGLKVLKAAHRETNKAAKAEAKAAKVVAAGAEPPEEPAVAGV